MGHDLYKAALMSDEESIRVILSDATIEEVNWTGEVSDVNWNSLLLSKFNLIVTFGIEIERRHGFDRRLEW